MNDNLPRDTRELAELFAVHLSDEEAVLAAALPIVRAFEAALLRGQASPTEILEQAQPMAGLLDEIKTRRRRFRETLAERVGCAADNITAARILPSLPGEQRQPLAACVERIRRLASEFVTLNRRLAIHLRIHLDAYQRLLVDLTGTAQGSGRYGPAGKPEAGELRPLVQVRG